MANFFDDTEACDPSGHLDIETLSAVLDGESRHQGGTGENQDLASSAVHLEACASCRSTLGQLRAVALAVAEPTPFNSTARDRAIAAALAADRANPAPKLAQAPIHLAGQSSPLPSASVEPSVLVADRRRSRARNQFWMALGSAAALAAAVVTSLSLLNSPSATGPLALDAPVDDASVAEAPVAPKRAGVEAAESLLGGPESAGPGSGTAGQAQVTADDRSADLGPLAGRPANLGEIGGPEELADVFLRLGGANQRSTIPGEPSTAPAPPCLAGAMTANSARSDALVYSGTGTRSGQPVVVLGFSPANGRPITLFVLEAAGCRLEYSVVVP